MVCLLPPGQPRPPGSSSSIQLVPISCPLGSSPLLAPSHWALVSKETRGGLISQLGAVECKGAKRKAISLTGSVRPLCARASVNEPLIGLRSLLHVNRSGVRRSRERGGAGEADCQRLPQAAFVSLPCPYPLRPSFFFRAMGPEDGHCALTCPLPPAFAVPRKNLPREGRGRESFGCTPVLT